MATVPAPRRGEIWAKSVSQTRFVRLLGQLTAAQLDAIASAIALCVGAP